MIALAVLRLALLAVIGLALSLAGGGAALAVQRLIRAQHRRSTLLKLAIVASPMLALALTLAVALPGVSDSLGLELAVLSHSHQPHAGHAHVPLHGDPAGPGLLAIALAVLAPMALLRCAIHVAEWRRSLGAVRQLQQLGRDASRELTVVGAGEVALTVGIETRRGWRVVMARAFRELLSDAELTGVLAHERAHRARGGNRQLMLIQLMGALHLPVLGPALVRAWRGTEELLCDLEARAATREPLELASALTKAHRLNLAPGRHELQPGGLVTSTALNMLVVPALYLRFGSLRRSWSRPDARGPRP